ncbi:MAG: bifunctional phosphopantothenoylcysteine decarboxylase/phosphopantothenate--cysteine ligase CoaBC [Paludibacteraceae bacterium]|nr:bifunctional phosphopantothenoylcysteine decarboxylase/phosphopantothenate--cysteine ligase CoaBC [Paludibacteraceae bacterium]
MNLAGKHILVGISGGIAAYKIPELIRLLKKAGADVQVTTTKNALEFVTSLTLQTVSGHKVYSDVFAAINEHSTEHISLPDWADMMLIAPATANVLCKMAHGIADDALTTTFAAMRKPVVIAPAMNTNMYESPATQEAIRTLSQWDNITMLDAASGELACGTTGKGRMQEVDVLVAAAEYALTPKTMTGKQVVITAGPTQEAIDPVRYISNASTGKMGYSLVRACLNRGAKVTLVSGPTHLSLKAWQQFCPLRVENVVSSAAMCEATVTAFEQADIAILCAAVADFTPCTTADKKIKKQPGQDSMVVELKTTTDIAATLGASKQAHQRLVGFALETHDEQANALRKLQSKNLDMIVLNSLQDQGAGFGTDTNKVTLLFADGTKKDLPLLLKQEVADVIVESILQLI